MSLADCPTELLELFVDQVSCQRTLRALRVVDSTFCAFATPRAFRTAYVTNNPQSVTDIQTLMYHAPLARHVRTVVFRWSDMLEEMQQDPRAQKTIVVGLIVIFATLQRFPALTALDISFFPRLWVDQRNAQGEIDRNESANHLLLQSVIIQALTRNTQLPVIRSLTLANLVPFPSPCYEDPGFARLLSSLEHFQVTAHSMNNLHAPNQNPEALWDWLWQEMVPIRFLRPPQRQLTSLSLVSDQPVGESPHIELSGLFYPALRHLTLGGVVFTSAQRAEDFIARHHRTLASLVLDSCPMHIDTGDAPARTWGQVCDRFNEELQALVHLEIIFRTNWGLDKLERSEETRLTYERSITGFGYTRGESCVPFEAADRSAVDKFVATVQSRKRRQVKTPVPLPPPVITSQEQQESALFVVPIL